MASQCGVKRGLNTAVAEPRATGLWFNESLRETSNGLNDRNTSPTAQKVKYVGLDVHGETIAVALAESTGDLRSYGNIPSHSHAIDRLHQKLTERGAEVRYLYEAGPTGFWLARHLRSLQIVCQVVSPYLIPKKASDRLKTDRRDAL